MSNDTKIEHDGPMEIESNICVNDQNLIPKGPFVPHCIKDEETGYTFYGQRLKMLRLRNKISLDGGDKRIFDSKEDMLLYESSKKIPFRGHKNSLFVISGEGWYERQYYSKPIEMYIENSHFNGFASRQEHDDFYYLALDMAERSLEVLHTLDPMPLKKVPYKDMDGEKFIEFVNSVVYKYKEYNAKPNILTHIAIKEFGILILESEHNGYGNMTINWKGESYPAIIISSHWNVDTINRAIVRNMYHLFLESKHSDYQYPFYSLMKEFIDVMSPNIHYAVKAYKTQIVSIDTLAHILHIEPSLMKIDLLFTPAF
jgi:hypothetical protein